MSTHPQWRSNESQRILRQIYFHLRRGLERHWVQLGVKSWQQADNVARHHRRGLVDAGLVICEGVLGLTMVVRPEAASTAFSCCSTARFRGVKGGLVARTGIEPVFQP